MKKYLILFLVILVCGSYADSYDNPFRFLDYHIVKKRMTRSYNPPRPGDLGNDDIGLTSEYYYQILLKEWLKTASRLELTPIITKSGCKACMSNDELWDSSSNILKKHYNVDTKDHDDSKRIYFHSPAGLSQEVDIGSSSYPFWLQRMGYIKTMLNTGYKREFVWILFSKTTRRAVWLKDDIANPDWKKVNLQEIRDDNVYTLFLRKLEWDSVKCHSLGTKNLPDVFSDGVDSVGALTIAVTAATKCYGAQMTPIAAKLMGNDKKHWLVYCFSTTIPSHLAALENTNDFLYDRYKEGLPLWNIGSLFDKGCIIGCKSFLSVNPTTNSYELWHIKIVTALISRETGQVLFME